MQAGRPLVPGLKTSALFTWVSHMWFNLASLVHKETGQTVCVKADAETKTKVHMKNNYAVIWDSMKMRMKTRMAGRMLAPIIQTGNCPSKPRGETSQPRLSGLDTENPLGTLSFCGPKRRTVHPVA